MLMLMKKLNLCNDRLKVNRGQSIARTYISEQFVMTWTFIGVQSLDMNVAQELQCSLNRLPGGEKRLT